MEIRSKYIICNKCGGWLRLSKDDNVMYIRKFNVMKEDEHDELFNMLKIPRKELKKRIKTMVNIDGVDKEIEKDIIDEVEVNNILMKKKALKRLNTNEIELKVTLKLAVKKDDGYYCPTCDNVIVRWSS